MTEHAKIVPQLAGLIHPQGEPIRLNRQKFVAIDRQRDAEYKASYRPQALYSRADNGFHANNEAVLLHEVATNLPIYRPDTGPTTFPNPTVVANAHVNEGETSRTAWNHPLHDRPAGACFWLQDALSLGALYKPLPSDGAIKSDATVYIRDLEIDVPSGLLATGHIIATDPAGQSLLPKSSSGQGDISAFAKSEVAIYRVIRGVAEFKGHDGTAYELAVGDAITAGKDAIDLVRIGQDTQILRLGLMAGIEALRSWTPTQRDDVDGLAGQIITHKELRSLRTDPKPVGYLYR